jgi:ketosteroid isomerase-like protein
MTDATTRAPHMPFAAAREQVRCLLERLEADWNRGNMEAYLGAYWNDDALVLSHAAVNHHGWRAVAELYRKTWPDPQAMGRFELHDMVLRPCDGSSVIAVGTFSHRFPELLIQGAVSLVCRHIAGDGWKIVLEHTSRGSTAAPG